MESFSPEGGNVAILLPDLEDEFISQDNVAQTWTDPPFKATLSSLNCSMSLSALNRRSRTRQSSRYSTNLDS